MRHFATLIAILLPLAADAGDDRESVDYKADVKPILELFCYECHGPIESEAGLRLDSYPGLMKGSEAGPVVEKGKAAESILIDVLEGKDGTKMPPEGDPVPSEDIEVIRKWIEQGAPGPEDEKPVDPNAHWSFVPPVRPAVPVVRGREWVRNPIDAFLLNKLEAKGLQHAPEADRATLMRRASLDLTGLAPGRDELHAFLADGSDDAYDRLVGRLMASPAYGERWARHWMDVWRYSDWYGFAAEVRNSQPHIWRWRDWIVESLNNGVPYDRMVTAMLAADEAWPGDEKELRATGYLVRPWYKFNRTVWLEAAVEHTNKAFLGVTLNCAKCHDHKYDPIPQDDFYRFRAIFEPYQVRTDRVPGQPDTAKDGLVIAYDAKADDPTYLFEKGDELRPLKDRVMAPGLPEALGGSLSPSAVELPPVAYYPGLRPYVKDQLLAAADEKAAEAGRKLEEARSSLEESRSLLAAMEAAGQGASVPISSVDPASRFLADDFAAPRPDLWAQGPGDWRHEDGRLVQSRDGPEEHALVSVADHPRDFRAEFRFRITGGSNYRSVGLTFDRDGDGNGHSVYLSAHGPGPKLQLSHRDAGGSSYPESGFRALPIETGKVYTLRVDVKDRKINAYVDGCLALVADLPGSRASGRISAWAFDATAEFLGFEAGALSEPDRLAETSKEERPYHPAPKTAEEARAAMAGAEANASLAELAEKVATSERDSSHARADADAARYAQSADPRRAEELSRAASAAERRAAQARALLSVAESEKALGDAKAASPADPKKTEEAEKAIAKAREEAGKATAARDQASSEYPPLTAVYPATSTGRRLSLARWITSRDNPLAARVAVNHVWMRHFGAPLVPTVFDFGRNGKVPTHPELLDWLAVELMESGWDLQHLQRLMVTSAAYRMRSSAAGESDPNLSADPTNAMYWRMNPRRMEAELVRDNVLAASGTMDRTLGGPDLDQATDQTVTRRSLYFRHAAEKQSLFLRLFDAANVNACYRRDESVVPQQALAMANSGLVLSQSRVLAGRLAAESGGDDAAFLTSAFETILGRGPTDREREMCLGFLDAQQSSLADASRLSAFGNGAPAGVAPAADPRQRAREGLVQVLFNHNDFVTIR